MRKTTVYESFINIYLIQNLIRMKLFLSIGVSSEKMQAGLKEICNHFHGKRTDAYIDTLVQEVEKANQSLFEVLYVNSVKRGVQQEA